jgi:hypothetical protein
MMRRTSQRTLPALLHQDSLSQLGLDTRCHSLACAGCGDHHRRSRMSTAGLFGTRGPLPRVRLFQEGVL